MPYLYGVVAQLVECLVRIQEVVGSTPISSTKQVLDEHLVFQRLFCNKS